MSPNTKDQHKNWEVENIPQNYNYEIKVKQEDGGVITVRGKAAFGYRRFINPNGKDVYELCVIVQGVQTNNSRRYSEHIPIRHLSERVKFNEGPISASPKKR